MIVTGILLIGGGFAAAIIAIFLATKGMLKAGAAVAGAVFEVMGDAASQGQQAAGQPIRPDVIMSRTRVSVSSSKVSLGGFLAKNLGLSALLAVGGLSALAGTVVVIFGVVARFTH